MATIMQNLKKSCAIVPTRGGYNRWAAIYDQDGNPLTALEEPIVRKLMGNVRGLRIADVGCGTGRHALYLAAQGAKVSAVDFSQGMLDKAKSKPGGKAVKFICHDVTRPLPFLNSVFDRVLSCLVLEHIKDIDLFFQELERICRWNGFILISAMHPAMWLKGQSARFFDVTTKQEVRPRSYPQQISDYVMAAMRSGLLIDHISEHAPDNELARRLPRAQKHIGWPMLVIMRLRRAD